MNDLITILINPKKEFRAVGQNTVSWLFLFIALLLIMLIIQIISFPLAEQVMKNSDIFSKMPPEQAEAIKNMGQKLKYVGLISYAFIFVVKMLFTRPGRSLCFSRKDKI